LHFEPLDARIDFMTIESPDPPPTFTEAEERFCEFLRSNGYVDDLRWVTGDQILIGDDSIFYVCQNGASDGRTEAVRRYEAGLRHNLGILLQALCMTDNYTVASIYIPTDKTDADYRRMLPRLKLSCPTKVIPAKIVVNTEDWATLKRETLWKSRMIRESFDL
jgi:hypothetical protein